MTLLQSGVDLLTIQAWLGHSQVATTHRYAAADVEMMRRGLEKAGVSGADAARFKPKDAVITQPHFDVRFSDADRAGAVCFKRWSRG